MILSYYAECFVSNINSKLDILVCKRSVDEVVVVRSDEDTSRNHFSNPFLMENKAVIVCYS